MFESVDYYLAGNPQKPEQSAFQATSPRTYLQQLLVFFGSWGIRVSIWDDPSPLRYVVVHVLAFTVFDWVLNICVELLTLDVSGDSFSDR